MMNSNNFTKLPLNDDEYIGTESCIDLQNEIEFKHFDTSKTNTTCVLIKSDSKKKEKREFPPTIPLLVGSHNNNNNNAWIMKRYYTNDGRLVLKEEKVKNHEYFRAHRANGRLTLDLASSP
ncbi:hypothetical protein Lal_00001687 [Lupinus albus]|nr:hypothetical protein Lal_00001687 [Lupinus albus]